MFQNWHLSSLDSFSENYHDLPESLVWNYMIDLLMAVKHLHDHDLVHLDIKPVILMFHKWFMIFSPGLLFVGECLHIICGSVEIGGFWPRY